VAAYAVSADEHEREWRRGREGRRKTMVFFKENFINASKEYIMAYLKHL
jgi:hypothetical protein